MYLAGRPGQVQPEGPNAAHQELFAALFNFLRTILKVYLSMYLGQGMGNAARRANFFVHAARLCGPQ